MSKGFFAVVAVAVVIFAISTAFLGHVSCDRDCLSREVLPDSAVCRACEAWDDHGRTGAWVSR